jgi:hypothetical protein
VNGLGAAPVQAAEPHGDRIQFCDATACLHEWAVVDSDGDGISDADEWVAGTDPHDASSRPRMSVLADLLAERQLPSFENGLAIMVVMPAELVELRAKAVDAGRLESLAFDGFPISDRADAVGRLGITAGSMKEDGGTVVEWTVTWVKKYVNPDAEDATTVDPEALEAWERTIFAGSRAIEGWRAPGTDGELPTPTGTFVAWVDSDLAIGAFVAYDEPRVTSAQPERRPGLPNPMAAAPTSVGKGCTDGYCAG